MELTPAFTFLFQASYDSGILPAVWKSAWITPIFKKGDKCVASHYRPVSLTCVACKLLEHILCSEIRKFLDEHGILTPYQHGFRKFFSCESQLLVTTHDLLKRLDVRDEVDIAILDFSKAFDVVPHKRLLQKLRLYGIEGCTLQWISNFLIGRIQNVMVNGVRSHSRSPTDGDCVFSGVPQGTVMGPLLFLLYMNDLPSVLDPATACQLFADDRLIYRSIKSLSDHVALQKDLESLHRWGETWGLKFNVSKCNIMHLSHKSVLPTRFYTLGGEVITSVSESKYLGVTFSNNYGTRSSQWKSHISQSASNANQRLAFLRHNLGGSPYKLRELAYISLVRSTMEYCGAIWDTTVKEECDRLEIVQRRAARWARGAKGIISVTALLKDLDWLPLADQRRHQRLGVFYKIINGQLQVPEHTVDIKRSKSPTLQSNSLTLVRESGRDKHSPYWKGTILRTIPEWKRLSDCTVTAHSFTTFKSRLAAAP